MWEIYEELIQKCYEINNLPRETDDDFELINTKYTQLKTHLENLFINNRGNIRIEEMNTSLACPKIQPEHLRMKHGRVFSSIDSLMRYIDYYNRNNA